MWKRMMYPSWDILKPQDLESYTMFTIWKVIRRSILILLKIFNYVLGFPKVQHLKKISTSKVSILNVIFRIK